MSALLEIEGLTVRFESGSGPVYAVNGIDLSIPKGRAVAIVGESGSGKSTAMMAVPRLLPANAHIGGQVRWNGRNLLALSDKEIRRLRGREISVIFQNPTASLNPIKPVGQQIMEPLLYHHVASAKDAEQRVIQLLGQVGIPDPDMRFKMYPFEFSGGMLQRVMIAMALIGEPELLIADEPTTALDVTVQSEILVLLKTLQQARGMSLVLITHDIAVAAQVCDEIYVLYGGLVMEHILSKDIVRKSAHPYLQGLLQSIPRLDAPRQPLPFIPGQPVSATQGVGAACVFADRCTKRIDRCSQRPPLRAHWEDHEVACWRVREEEFA